MTGGAPKDPSAPTWPKIKMNRKVIIDPYTSEELTRLALKIQAGRARLTEDEKDHLVEVLRNLRDAQVKWDHIYSAFPAPSRPVQLIAVLARILQRWDR